MNKPKIYLGGDIMTKGSKLAREEEYKGVLNMEQIVEILKNKYGEDDMEVMINNEKKHECTSQKMA